MPAVTVLALGNNPVGAVPVGTDPHLLESMAGPEGLPDPQAKSTGKEEAEPAEDPASKGEQDALKPAETDKKDSGSAEGTVSPSQSSASYPHALPAHLTPQQPGYYVAYQSQVTPEPPSPGLGGTAVYDVGNFLQQPTGFHHSPFTVHQYTGGQPQPGQAPHSPTQNSMGGIPPASPIFPRMTGQAVGFVDPHGMVEGGVHRGAPVSPAPAYLSPALGPSGMYPAMGAYNAPPQDGSSVNNGSSEEASAWGDVRNAQTQGYAHGSPQVGAQGMPIPYVPGIPPRAGNAAGRSYSFEETMLPPAADSQQSQQDQAASFSTYNQNSGGNGTLFAHQQPWGYGGPPPEMYGASASPLQPRPTMSYPGMHAGVPRHPGPPHMGPYGGQFFPATSPGPPIQTTASNKGPDGANLFIFHIPNHFTNMDMYQLFYPYGNLLSVRIMVEKDTGRSRGFGFVSYDTPDAAALAIKELNGFAIGNKRLKVQHKQIRPSDQHNDRSHPQNPHSGYDHHPSGGYGRPNMPLPPSNNAWFGQPRTAMPANMGPSETNEGTQPESSEDPLSSLEPLRQALPDEGEGGN